MLNVSKRSVASATKVMTAGAPELAQAVDRGEVAVSAAADIVELPSAEQRDLVALGGGAVAKAAKIIRARKKRRSQREVQDERLDLALFKVKVTCQYFIEGFPDERLATVHGRAADLIAAIEDLIEDDDDADDDRLSPAPARAAECVSP
jgi:hypothetical protein